VAARLGVIADAHANLPALDAALAALAERDCDVVVHAGDAVGIGPHPSEVVARLREARVLCVMGNHDEWAAFGVPDPLPAGMGAAEAGHHRWARDRLDAPARAAIAAWPDELALTVGPAAVTVVHYARTPAGPFDFVPQASAADLARLFAPVPGDAVVFGHDHAAYDCAADGRRLVSPGSLGCHDPRWRGRWCCLPSARAAPRAVWRSTASRSPTTTPRSSPTTRAAACPRASSSAASSCAAGPARPRRPGSRRPRCYPQPRRPVCGGSP
jgi:putative phosphoesterase